MRATIYARVSEDPRGQQRSVKEQEQACREWAAREGWDVVDVISETGSASRSARSTRARTKWPELVAAVSSGSIDILLTWEASRATRQMSEYVELVELCRDNKVLWGYSGTVYDLSTRDGMFRTGLDALISQDESERTRERILRSVRSRASQGRPHGKIPYGYRREYDPGTGALLRQVPDEETAPHVVDMFRRVIAGESLYSIAKYLTEQGVPMPRPARTRFDDRAWIPMSVRQIVRSATYAGKRLHKGVVVADAEWEALVSDEVFAAANAVLDGNASRASNPSGDSRATHLLTGIAKCGRCNGPMIRIKNRGSQSYNCKWCFKVSRIMSRTDESVTRKVLALLEHAPAASSSTSSEEAKDAWAAARALRERLDSFADQAAEGQLTAGSLARVEARLLPQIHAAEAKARKLSVPAALDQLDLSDPAALWESLDLEGRRSLIRRAVNVQIHSAGRGARTWDDSLIEVTPVW